MYKALGLISRRKKKKERKRKEGRKRQSIEWKELFAYHISGNGLASRIHIKNCYN
jgi:hypothetical protein